MRAQNTSDGAGSLSTDCFRLWLWFSASQPGAVVLDVGINAVSDASKKRGYRLVGDVDFAPVAEVASAITPVPGGVGPMTIAILLQNTLQAAIRHQNQ